jgi:ArsR family transcriptional regulator
MLLGGKMIKNCCEYCDDEQLSAIRKHMPDEETLTDLSEFFKIFGDSTRIKIICVLFEGEMCVSGIVDILEMSQSSISHQLRILKTQRIVKAKKIGKQVFYSLDDNHIKMIYEMGLDHLFERG